MSQVVAYCAVPDLAQGWFGPETVEAWPAAGGGLLVGIVEPAFAGAAPLRRTVKTIFIRIDGSDVIRVILPYVALEDEARACIRFSIAAELCVDECRIKIETPDPAMVKPIGIIIDIDPDAENSLRVCAAVARTRLVSAMAERLGLALDLYQIADGAVFVSDACIPYSEIAADAASCDAPGVVQLHGGPWVALSKAMPNQGAPADVDVRPLPEDRDQSARI
jgi:hypothetical protein